jgi:maltose-binding protein MalE
LVFLLSLYGCQLVPPDEGLNGRITLWHSWTAEEALILEETLDQFQEIHPDVQIITTAFPYNQILAEFIVAGEEGLGPTLLLGTDSWISDLADAGLIRALSPELAALDLFNRRNLALTQYHDQQYGIPLALAPRALYYNKSLVSAPPTTLDELLQEAAAGHSVAFVPRFTQAYWGIQAFGTGLFDDQGHFTLAESGFSEWLSWLNEAQNAPGVILNVDDPSLLSLFASGQVAYYVAGPEVQAQITSLMDDENPFEMGVAPLPGLPEAPAGPLLSAEVIMFYTYGSDEELAIARELAVFLVNQQQSIRFLRELDRVPANPDVRVDPRVYANVFGFAQQSRTAVVIPNAISADLVVEAGNRAYANVLSDALTPAEAVCNFGREVAELQRYTETTMSVPEECDIFVIDKE